MASKTWLKTPDDISLSNIAAWEKIGKNRYRAIRRHILMVQRRDTHPKNGPIISELTLPSGSEIRHEHKVVIAQKHTNSITNSIQSAISTKITSEFSSRQTDEIRFSPISLNLKNESFSRTGSEFAKSLGEQLAGAESYELANTEELVRTLKLMVPEGDVNKRSKYFFYLPVWRWEWDLFLYKIETLELSYKKKWFWWQVRDSINYEVIELKLPLSRIVFYEPQQEVFSVETENYEPEVQDPTEIVVTELTGICPSARDEDSMTLERFAEIAFPVTQEEENISRRISSVIHVKQDPKEIWANRVTRKLVDQKTDTGRIGIVRKSTKKDKAKHKVSKTRVSRTVHSKKSSQKKVSRKTKR